jgi:hypothetical protein
MNSLSDAILQSNSSNSFADSLSPVSSSTSDGFSILGISWTTWLIIILLLAFLGFNVFLYLAKGTEDIVTIFAPITKKLFGTSVAVAGQTIDVAAEGAKQVVGSTADVVQSGLSAVQELTPNELPSKNKYSNVNTTAPPKEDALQQALNKSSSKIDDYQAYDAPSSVHSAGKSGWCLIGEDRGFRSCARVDEEDVCVSGQIYPTQDVCINPNLRP